MTPVRPPSRPPSRPRSWSGRSPEGRGAGWYRRRRRGRRRRRRKQHQQWWWLAWWRRRKRKMRKSQRVGERETKRRDGGRAQELRGLGPCQ